MNLEQRSILYLFDLDGTLIKSYMEDRSPYDDVVLLPGRKERLAAIAANPKNKIGIVTNQGGVAFGYVTPEQFIRKLENALVALGLPLDTPYRVCYSDTRGKAPYNDPADASRRKPSGTMITEIREELSYWPFETVMIGDRQEDSSAAAAAEVSFIHADEFFGRGQQPPKFV